MDLDMILFSNPIQRLSHLLNCMERKNKISHRAIAAEKMKEILESYLKKETI